VVTGASATGAGAGLVAAFFNLSIIPSGSRILNPFSVTSLNNDDGFIIIAKLDTAPKFKFSLTNLSLI
jgi:hypothetical protein